MITLFKEAKLSERASDQHFTRKIIRWHNLRGSGHVGRNRLVCTSWLGSVEREKSARTPTPVGLSMWPEEKVVEAKVGVNANWILAPDARKDIASVRERRRQHVILDRLFSS